MDDIEWHKFIGILLHKYRRQLGEVIITEEDVEAFRRRWGIDSAVVAIEHPDGIRIALMTEEEAQATAREIRARSES